MGSKRRASNNEAAMASLIPVLLTTQPPLFRCLHPPPRKRLLHTLLTPLGMIQGVVRLGFKAPRFFFHSEKASRTCGFPSPSHPVLSASAPRLSGLFPVLGSRSEEGRGPGIPTTLPLNSVISEKTLVCREIAQLLDLCNTWNALGYAHLCLLHK